MKVFVKEKDLVVGDLYHLPHSDIKAFFVGCFNSEKDEYVNFFYPTTNAKKRFFIEDDGTVGFTMDNDDNYLYEEV